MLQGHFTPSKRHNGKQFSGLKKSLVDKARVLEKCFQFLPKSDETMGIGRLVATLFNLTAQCISERTSFISLKYNVI